MRAERRPRALLVSHQASRTGAPRVAIDVARGLSDAGFEVTVVHRWGGPLAPEIDEVADRALYEPMRRLRAVLRERLRARRAARVVEGLAARLVLARTRPDVVWCNTVMSGSFVAPARRRGIPVVLHVHETGELLAGGLRRYPVDAADHGIVLVACSGASADHLAELLGRSRRRIDVVTSAIDVSEVRARGAKSLPSTPFDLVAVGTADRLKGSDVMASAATRIDGRCGWAGRVNGALPEGPVTWLGELDDPAPLMAAAKVVAVPSRADAFPLVVLEAMALGKPIVASAVGGIPAQLGDAGVLVEPGDPEQLAAAINRLLHDPDEAARLGMLAADRVTQFDSATLRARVGDIARRAVSHRRRRLAVLKAPSFAEFATSHDGRLPYGIDALRELGWDLRWTDQVNRLEASPAGRIVKRLDRLGAPWMQTAAMLPTRWSPSCTGTLAFFESEGHALALARSFVPRFLRRRHPLVVVTCWLGDLAPRLSRTRRALYRCAYRGVDRVVVFSGNQAPILQDAYGIDSSKIRVVDFGVDVREVHGVAVSEDGGVVAVGRDAGRDWATFLAAVEGTDWPVHLATRPRSLEGLTLPPNVTMHGYVDRRRYLELLAGATVVVVPTLDRAYPTGQTVLLEAMALGKACIVTATAAMEGYLRPDVDCLTVGLGDIDALRQAIGELLGDPARRTRLGEQARASVAARFTAERMWSAIADVLSELDERDRAPR